MSVARRPVIAGVAVLAVAALAALLLIPRGASGSHDRAGLRVLTLTYSFDAAELVFQDNAPPGLSGGDVSTTNAPLSRGGKVVGSLQRSGIGTDGSKSGGGHGMVNLGATIRGRGSLVAVGPVRYVPDPRNPGHGTTPDRYTLAIVGGTGAYAGAAGQVHLSKAGRRRILRFRFTR